MCKWIFKACLPSKFTMQMAVNKAVEVPFLWSDSNFEKSRGLRWIKFLRAIYTTVLHRVKLSLYLCRLDNLLGLSSGKKWKDDYSNRLCSLVSFHMIQKNELAGRIRNLFLPWISSLKARLCFSLKLSRTNTSQCRTSNYFQSWVAPPPLFRGQPFDFFWEREGLGRPLVISENKIPADWFRGKKYLARKYLGKKDSLSSISNGV